MQNQLVKQEISNIILEAGIPANLIGYKYLTEAILKVMDNEELINRLTTETYPLVAERFDTTWGKVERSIRHAIGVAFNSGKMKNINKRFGLQIMDDSYKPSNGQLIALIADRLLLEHRNNEAK